MVFAAPAATSAQAIAWNTVQRMAIEADPAWQGGRYRPGKGPSAGLAAARALAMITYRAAVEFTRRSAATSSRTPGRFDVDHYLRRQGDKLVARFDAASYVALMRAMDLHDVGDCGRPHRNRCAGENGHRRGGGLRPAVSPGEVRDWTDAYPRPGRTRGTARSVSPAGHDAFLIEWDQVEAILREP